MMTLMVENDVICVQTFKFVDFFLQEISKFFRFTHSILSLHRQRHLDITRPLK